jgi:hypothetical protein
MNVILLVDIVMSMKMQSKEGCSITGFEKAWDLCFFDHDLIVV